MFEGLRFKHWSSEQDADRHRRPHHRPRRKLSQYASPARCLTSSTKSSSACRSSRRRGWSIRSGKAAGFIAGADIREFESYGRSGTVLDAISFGQGVLQQPGATALPDGCRDSWPLHGRRHRTGARLQLSRRQSRSVDTNRTARSQARHLPGWGGSARLPYLIGAPKALELMLTGRAVSAEYARADRSGRCGDLAGDARRARQGNRSPSADARAAAAPLRPGRRISGRRARYSRRSCASRPQPRRGPSTIPHRSR